MSNYAPYQVYKYSHPNAQYGTGTWGSPLKDPTGLTALNVTQIIGAYGGLDVLTGTNTFVGAGKVMQFHDVDSGWSYLTGGTSVKQIASSGGTLYMVGNNGGANQAWQYTGIPYSWTQLTWSPSNVYQVAVDGSNLYMVADNGKGKQVWQYSGTPYYWTAMSDPTQFNLSTGVSSWIATAPDGKLWVYGNFKGTVWYFTYTSTTVGGTSNPNGGSTSWTNYTYTIWTGSQTGSNSDGYYVPGLFV